MGRGKKEGGNFDNWGLELEEKGEGTGRKEGGNWEKGRGNLEKRV